MKFSLWLGRLGTWLCDRYSPRPATSLERAQSSQYCELMIACLRGDVSFYGRDRAMGAEPVIAERVDYEQQKMSVELVMERLAAEEKKRRLQ